MDECENHTPHCIWITGKALAGGTVVCLPFCLPAFLPAYLPAYLPACLSVCLSDRGVDLWMSPVCKIVNTGIPYPAHPDSKQDTGLTSTAGYQTASTAGYATTSTSYKLPAHDRICQSTRGNCPVGFVQITSGLGNYWGCGSGCPIHHRTDNECHCSCQPRGCTVLVKNGKSCPAATKPCSTFVFATICTLTTNR